MSVVIPPTGEPLYRRSFAQLAAELGLTKPKRRTEGRGNTQLAIPAQRRPVIDPMRAER